MARAGLSPLASEAAERFSAYAALLSRWNSRFNLSSIRTPEEILQRHFVECIFCAQVLPDGIRTLLDYGSGAGFPGIPIALCRPEIKVTLAESQGKKASFLREAVRTLGIKADVHGGRVEEMTTGMVFDAVTLRAVDKMQMAVTAAVERVAAGGWLVVLGAAGDVKLPDGLHGEELLIPGSHRRVVVKAQRLSGTGPTHVPRGTLT